jgi:hypothetical protein
MLYNQYLFESCSDNDRITFSDQEAPYDRLIISQAAPRRSSSLALSPHQGPLERASAYLPE